MAVLKGISINSYVFLNLKKSKSSSRCRLMYSYIEALLSRFSLFTASCLYRFIIYTVKGMVIKIPDTLNIKISKSEPYRIMTKHKRPYRMFCKAKALQK